MSKSKKALAEIANKQIAIIQDILADPNNPATKLFDDFIAEHRHAYPLGNSSRDEFIEMLAVHQFTKPIFNRLFAKYDFVKEHKIVAAMDKILLTIDCNLKVDNSYLDKFYADILTKLDNATDDRDKQTVIIEVYGSIFQQCFPMIASRLGIVYTPIEIVDFIINSVDEIIKKEFGEAAGLGSDRVQILDPFTGTGIFITRLLQSGYIPMHRFKQKYLNDISAYEITLIAFYIASINIEITYQEIMGEHEAFPGLVHTDTFKETEPTEFSQSSYPMQPEFF